MLELEQRKKIETPTPESMVGRYEASYSCYYQSETDDSPDESRASMVKRIQAYIYSFGALNTNLTALDVGAGRQILESEYRSRSEKNMPAVRLRTVTMDLAAIPRSNLLGNPMQNLHVRTNGQCLPFANETFDLVISNMALDFMGPKAMDEAYRVMKKGGKFLFNFHHPTLIPYDIDYLVQAKRRRIFQRLKFRGKVKEKNIRELEVLQHHKFLKDTRQLFETTDQVEKDLVRHGFFVERIGELQGAGDKWWEADGHKE